MPRDAGWEQVMERFGWFCVWPGCWSAAVAVHEEPPRSLQAMRDEDRYPLCLEHHESVHRLSREAAKAELEKGAAAILAYVA